MTFEAFIKALGFKPSVLASAYYDRWTRAEQSKQNERKVEIQELTGVRSTIVFIDDPLPRRIKE